MTINYPYEKYLYILTKSTNKESNMEELKPFTDNEGNSFTIEDVKKLIAKDKDKYNRDTSESEQELKQPSVNLYDYENLLLKQTPKLTNTKSKDCKHYLTRNEVICDAMGNVIERPVECLICNKQFINY